MSIKDWPQAEQPCEKLIAQGAKMLSNAELIAILLNTGHRDKTALDLARDLLRTHKTLRKLLTATPIALQTMPGIGSIKYARLQAAIELSKRHLEESLVQLESIEYAHQVHQFMMAKLRDYESEVFAALFLNSRCQVIQFEELFQGTVNEAPVYPREVARRALTLNASAVVVAHNHPTGSPLPSDADKVATRALKNALELIEVRLLDHLIIADTTVLSFTDLGLL